MATSLLDFSPRIEMTSSRLMALAVSTCLLAAPAGAQDSVRAAERAAGAAATLPATRLAGEIRIDGRLDDEAWSRAPAATDFTQSYPEPGAAPTQRTEARVLYDDTHLYVGVRMYDTSPDSIAAPLARRDPSGIYSDWLHVIVDSRYDRRTAFRFSVNPRGVQRDVYTFDDGNEDGSWDAVWEVATQIDSLGWTAEYRIPMSQLRFGGEAGESRTWGLQIMRDIARRGERASWSPWTRDVPGFVSRFGTLTGIEGVRSPRALEIQPYATARLTRVPGDAQNPFYRETQPGAAVGADLRMGLPAGMTLSATINPDFGQVEADPAEVNLSAFETFFSERRPFFTEGADIFRFGETRAFNRYGFQEYFYSRRVGRSPQRRLAGPAYQFVDAPQQTRILGAAKISGRTQNGWSVGIMNATTDREEARFIGTDGVEQAATVEPLSNYFVGRVRRDMRAGGTVVGGLFTTTYRWLNDEALEPLLHSDAQLGGLDFLHTWGNRAFSVSGYVAGSRVSGSADALLATQRSSARYFQRPDAGHVEVDATRTSLQGHIAELSFAHSGPWMASIQLKEVSPGFEINDLGFQSRVDARSVATFLGRRVNRAWGPFQNHGYQTWAYRAWNFDGDRILDGMAVSGNATFHNFWSAGLNVTGRPEYVNDRLTRGGPLASTPSQWLASGWVETDPRKSVSFGANFNSRTDGAGARERSLGVGVDVRPSNAVRLRLRPQWSANEVPAQYVRAFNDARADGTYGVRYVFAELDQTTVSLETRLDWTFTPRLSLQLFAQPFVSAGDYERFKEFTTPGGFAFDEFGADRGTICRFGGAYVVDPVAARQCPADAPPAADADFTMRFGDPDFNIRSLRGNAVVRWEYRPGSTLFFVWQQQRSGFAPLGQFDLERDSRAIFDAPAHNVFLIKASYWIGR
jgi:hypothetical protein